MRNQLLWGMAVTAATAAGLLFTTAAQAQEPVNPVLPIATSREFSISGSVTLKPKYDARLRLGYGVFIDSKFEVGGQVDYSDPSFGPSSTSIGVFGNYHFPGTSQALPFIGFNTGYSAQQSPGKSSSAFGLQGGVKYFINNTVAATTTLLYRNYTDGGRADDLGIDFGISFFLR